MPSDELYSLLKRLDAYHDLALREPRLTYPLRLLSFGAYRGLELALGGRHPHERTIAQARELQRQAAPALEPHAGATRSRVVFFSPRGWYAHTGFEAIVAKALELRGARSEFVLCGGGLRQCDFKPASDPHVTAPLCWRCQGFPRRLLEAFGLPARDFDDLLADESRARARELTAGLDLDGLRELRYAELAIGQLCLPSLLRSLLRTDLQPVETATAILRGLCESAIVTADLAQALIRERPDVIVVCNGRFHAERVMCELARRAGIRIVSYEMGWTPGSYFLVHSDRGPNGPRGVAADFPLDEAWQTVRARSLPVAQRERIVQLLGERRQGRAGLARYWPKMEGDRDSLANRLGLRPGQRIAAAFPNIVWDTAVFDRDIGFGGMFDWLRQTILDFATRPEWLLVVRTHPAEARLVMQETRERVVDRIAEAFPSLAPNVRVIAPEDPLNSYALAELAQVVLVYTSSLGLESACAGRPVVTAGRVHYAQRGFTFDVGRRDEYLATIERAFACGGLPEDQRESALRYAHMLFFESMKAFPFLGVGSRAQRGLTFTELSALAPGRDQSLDAICAGILEGTPFVS